MRREDDDVLSTIIDASEDAIVLVDTCGTITSWNAGATSVYGYTQDETIGRPVRSFLTGDERVWSEAFQGKSGSSIEGPRSRKDGAVVIVSEALAPLCRDGEVLGVASISRDVSARRRTDEALAAARRQLELKNDRLEQMNVELEQFAYVASHDLSEPLRAVAGMVELLERRYKGRLDADADDFIRFAVNGCVRMKAMIDDLLAYARVGRSSGDRSPVNTAVTVATVIAALDAVIEESAATISVGELPTVMAEPTELAHVLQNLLSNAIKFRRPNVAPEVEVSAEREGMAWRFCVADNGVGIESKDASRIFRMFQRLHARDEFPGTGIGLAIAERIITDLGGRLWVEPRRTVGSKFCFTIPDASADPRT